MIRKSVSFSVEPLNPHISPVNPHIDALVRTIHKAEPRSNEFLSLPPLLYNVFAHEE
jgi:hypothetical protein